MYYREEMIAGTMGSSTDGATKNTEWTRIPLTAYDNIMPRIYAYTLYILETKPGLNIQDNHKSLEGALQLTTEELPFLVGELRLRKGEDATRKGLLEVHVPPRTAAVARTKIRFQDLRDKLSLEDLLEDGIPDDKLDSKLLLPAELMPDLRGGPPVMVCQANYIDGGCILGVGVHHSVCDGAAMSSIMSIWSKHLRSLPKPTNSASASSPQSFRGSNDREAMNHENRTRPDSPHRVTFHNASKELWRLLGVNDIGEIKSPEAVDEARCDEEMLTGIFYMSEAALLQVKVEAGALGHVTANDALMAFLWQATMRARFAGEDEESLQQREAILDSTVDARPYWSPAVPPNYLGNAVLMNTARMPLWELIAPGGEGLVQASHAARRALSGITPDQARAAYALADSLPDCTTLTFPFATFTGSQLTITSVLNNPIFEQDFGSDFGNGGGCVAVRPPRSEFAAICRRCIVLPRQPSGGCEILIAMFRSEMDRLLSDQYFGRFAKLSSTS